MDLFKLAIQLVSLLAGVVIFAVGISLVMVILAIGLHVFGRHSLADKIEEANLKLWRGVKSGITSITSKMKEV